MSPGAVFGDAPGFLLRETRHDGDEQFAFAVEGPDIFLFKVALDAVFLELADGRKAVHGVPSESADRLGDDQVDLSGERNIQMHMPEPKVSDFHIPDQDFFKYDPGVKEEVEYLSKRVTDLMGQIFRDLLHRHS